MLDPLHETIDHLLLAGLFEGDRELVAVDLHHLAAAEFLVEDAIAVPSLRRVGGSGNFDQCHHIGLDVVCDFGISLEFSQGSRTR